MAGQPTKYDPKYCDELVQHMSEGYSLESFAGRIGVHRDTLYAWRDAHSEFSDAIKKGKDASLFAWEGKLREGVTQRDINIAPVLFALKCRFGYKETQAVEHSGPDGKPIETKSLSNLSDADLDAKIQTLMGKVKESNEG